MPQLNSIYFLLPGIDAKEIIYKVDKKYMNKDLHCRKCYDKNYKKLIPKLRIQN